MSELKLCEAHTEVNAPGNCPICMMERIADLESQLRCWQSIHKGTLKALKRYMDKVETLTEFGEFQLRRAEKLLKENSKQERKHEKERDNMAEV